MHHASQHSLKSHLISQFAHPRGALGRVAGSIMSLRASNRARNRWTVECLDLEPGHRVLEIGSGPGLALELVAARLDSGSVDGCDHSDLMIRTAGRRNRPAIEAGRVRLHRASIEELAAGRGPVTGPFDRIFGVNVGMFVTDPVAVFRGLRALLVPGGRFVITHQPRVGDTSAAASHRAAERLVEAMRSAGLTEVGYETLESLDPPAVCVTGHEAACAGPPRSFR